MAQDSDAVSVSESARPQIILRTDARLRYESADIEGVDRQVDGLTLRLRPSIEFIPAPSISILAEAEAIVSALPEQLDGLFDQQGLELNRLQIEFAPGDSFSMTVGRQAISLDDERFIGTVDFRQNQQTYDAVTAALQGPQGLTVRAGYIWRVGRALGPEQPDGVFESDSFFVNAATPTPIGQVSLFHYDLELDDRLAKQIRSQTSGASLRGRGFFGDLGLFWEAGYARQASMGAAPEFIRAALRANLGDFTVAAKFEELGSDAGIAFQTPLATLHKFQGAADLFLTTPPDGLRDFEASAIWRIGSIGPARATLIGVQYNRFNAATGGDSGAAHYGDEWSARIATSLASTRFSIEAAHFRANTLATDTTRVWLTAERRF